MNNMLQMWIVQKGKYFPFDAFVKVQDILSKLPETKLASIYALPLKNPAFILVMCFFALDRLILGDIKKGLLKLLWPFIAALLTIPLSAPIFPEVLMIVFLVPAQIAWVIWIIYDLFTSMKRARDYNLKILMKAIGRLPTK